jgi:hypothetical protein
LRRGREALGVRREAFDGVPPPVPGCWPTETKHLTSKVTDLALPTYIVGMPYTLFWEASQSGESHGAVSPCGMACGVANAPESLEPLLLVL